METSALFQNEAKNRFEIEAEGTTAFIEYHIDSINIINLTHTEVPQALSGKGIGKSIVEKALSYLKEHKYQIIPSCPFISAYIKRHPEWLEIVHKDYKIK